MRTRQWCSPKMKPGVWAGWSCQQAVLRGTGKGLSPRSEVPPGRGEVAGTPAWRSQSAGEPTRPTQAGWALAPRGILSRWEGPCVRPTPAGQLGRAPSQAFLGPDSKP